MITLSTIEQLNRGDLCLLSPESCSADLFHGVTADPLLRQDIAIYRLDGEPGTHAIRPYMNEQSPRILLDTAKLLARSRNEALQKTGLLMTALSYAYRQLEQGQSVNSFDDILMLLQPQAIASTIVRLERFSVDAAAKLMKVANDVGYLVAPDQYGYVVNVVLHNMLKLWGEIGVSQDGTLLLNEAEIAHINVMVLPTNCADRSLAENGEDIVLPVLEHLIGKLFQSDLNDGTLHLDPALYPRLSGLRTQVTHGFLSLHPLADIA